MSWSRPRIHSDTEGSADDITRVKKPIFTSSYDGSDFRPRPSLWNSMTLDRQGGRWSHFRMKRVRVRWILPSCDCEKLSTAR